MAFFPLVPVEEKTRVAVLLIAPSSYDDDGFVRRYLKGVITTSGLLTLASLTKQALRDIGFKPNQVKVRAYEDVLWLQSFSIYWFCLFWRLTSLLYRLIGIRSHLIVGLVGAQSHQFPRAVDLINRWQARGATCVIGGPHVTGSISAMLDGLGNRGEGEIPCPQTMPPEIENLQKQGVIIFHGEAEPHPDGTNVWRNVILDILHPDWSPRPLYYGGRPDITGTPLPELKGPMLKYFSRRLVPLNESRGCPFACKFCSVITMQGRLMRCRSPEIVVNYFRMLCRRYGRARVFITGDNFARNKYRDEILSKLTQLRQEGQRITFMIQADVDACLKDETLIPRLAAAGCNMIFFGVETLNQRNLVTAGKKHNLGRDLPLLWTRCHEHNIIVHAAYMIGFPFDTIESVKAEVDQLFEYGADHASFYIRGPIPGCEDWIRAISAGQYIDLDRNKYDSQHCVTDQGLQMNREQCEAAYQAAWRRFYSLSHMIRARQRFANRATRWGLLLVHLWYWWAIRVEKTHPMIAGFYRFRPYWDRRPGAKPLSFWRYCGQEIWRHLRYFGYYLVAFYTFQQVELETECNLCDTKDTVAGKLRGVRDWLYRTFGPMVSRRWLNDFWVRYARNRWQLLNPIKGIIWHLKMVPYAITEVVYSIRFALMLRRIIKAVRA